MPQGCLHVVPLTLRGDIGIETRTLSRHHHRGPTEVARIQRRRDQRPDSSLIRGRGNPGLVQLATSGLRHRLGLLFVVALSVTSHAKMIWHSPSTLAWALPQQSHPLLLVRMIDNSGSVKLVCTLSRRSLHDRTGHPTTTLGPGELPLGFGLLATLPFGVRHRPRFGFQPLHRRLNRRQAVLPPTQILGQIIPTPRTLRPPHLQHQRPGPA